MGGLFEWAHPCFALACNYGSVQLKVAVTMVYSSVVASSVISQGPDGPAPDDMVDGRSRDFLSSGKTSYGSN